MSGPAKVIASYASIVRLPAGDVEEVDEPVALQTADGGVADPEPDRYGAVVAHEIAPVTVGDDRDVDGVAVFRTPVLAANLAFGVRVVPRAVSRLSAIGEGDAAVRRSSGPLLDGLLA